MCDQCEALDMSRNIALEEIWVMNLVQIVASTWQWIKDFSVFRNPNLLGINKFMVFDVVVNMFVWKFLKNIRERR